MGVLHHTQHTVFLREADSLQQIVSTALSGRPKCQCPEQLDLHDISPTTQVFGCFANPAQHRQHRLPVTLGQ
ncbi:hypothetical protein D3C81_2165520 [compost metagenome]